MTDHIRIVDTCQGFAELEPYWSALASSDRFTPFQSFAWNRAWWEHVGAYDPNKRLHIVVVEDSVGIRAIAPLFVDGQKECRSLKVLGDPYADYHDFVTREIEDDCGLVRIVQYICGGLGYRWDRVLLAEVAPQSPLHRVIGVAKKAGVLITPASECPRLQLDDPIAMASISGKKEYARKKRRLEELGRVDCVYHVNAESITARLSTYMEMHRNQWLPRPDCGITFQDPEIIRFYSGSVEPLARDRLLMLVELRVDARPIAFYYGYTFAATFWGYRPTFDITLAKYSPGHVMHHLMFNQLLHHGFRVFDFMRGSFQYKFRYASHTRRNTSYALDKLTEPVAR